MRLTMTPPSGLSDGSSHTWLFVNGKIVDLTADQFNDRGYSYPAVMITSDTTFYDLFADHSAALQSSLGHDDTLPHTPMVTASQVQKILKNWGWN